MIQLPERSMVGVRCILKSEHRHANLKRMYTCDYMRTFAHVHSFLTILSCQFFIAFFKGELYVQSQCGKFKTSNPIHGSIVHPTPTRLSGELLSYWTFSIGNDSKPFPLGLPDPWPSTISVLEVLGGLPAERLHQSGRQDCAVQSFKGCKGVGKLREPWCWRSLVLWIRFCC